MSDIANIIYQQIGGRGFSMMTGAKYFVAGERHLTFKIGRNSSKCNYITIELDDSDTYNIHFQRLHGNIQKTLQTSRGIYCDMLRGVIAKYTGLCLTVPTIRKIVRTA